MSSLQNKARAVETLKQYLDIDERWIEDCEKYLEDKGRLTDMFFYLATYYVIQRGKYLSMYLELVETEVDDRMSCRNKLALAYTKLANFMKDQTTSEWDALWLIDRIKKHAADAQVINRQVMGSRLH